MGKPDSRDNEVIFWNTPAQNPENKNGLPQDSRPFRVNPPLSVIASLPLTRARQINKPHMTNLLIKMYQIKLQGL